MFAHSPIRRQRGRANRTNAAYRQAFDLVYSRYAPDMAGPEADDAHEHWIGLKKGEIESSGFFGPVMVRQYPWSLSYDAERYLELLGTYSDHVLLPEQRRSGLFQALKEEIEKLGGSIIKKYLTVLFFAKRAEPTQGVFA